MADINITDFLGSWASSINNEIKKAYTDPRILNDPNGEYLVSYLPFDKSVSEDVCGNVWEVSGNPTISDGALSVNNSDKKGSLILPSIELGGQDFTISLWAKMSSYSPDWSLVFEMKDNSDYVSKIHKLGNYNDFNMCIPDYTGSSYNGSRANDGTWNNYFEIDYTKSDGYLRAFHNGVLVQKCPRYMSRQKCRIRLVDNSGEYGTLIGYIDDFKIYDGVALHTADFTPPTRA